MSPKLIKGLRDLCFLLVDNIFNRFQPIGKIACFSQYLDFFILNVFLVPFNLNVYILISRLKMAECQWKSSRYVVFAKRYRVLQHIVTRRTYAPTEITHALVGFNFFFLNLIFPQEFFFHGFTRKAMFDRRFETRRAAG